MTLHPLQATLLGVIEGLTEFLPVSSTGHLILAAWVLGLEGEAVKTFEIVIQAGSLAAVLGLYRGSVRAMWRGALGRDEAGRRLLVNLGISFVPAALLGVLLHRAIKAWLFAPSAVVAALALGGVLMIVVDGRRRPPRGGPPRALSGIRPREALLIGLAQCASLWPGTSRSMATIVAGLLLGFPATVAAEYSFLLALPTLGAATVFDAIQGGSALAQELSPGSVACGFVSAGLVAALAIRGFIRYLTTRGLAPFGWYRLGLAAAVWAAASQR